MFGRFARTAAGVIGSIPGCGSAYESAPKTEGGLGVSLIRAQRVVVKRAVRTSDRVSTEIEQERQDFFHDTDLLFFMSLPRRPTQAPRGIAGSSRADRMYYLVRRPWLGITPFQIKKPSPLLAGRQFEKLHAARRAISLSVEL